MVGFVLGLLIQGLIFGVVVRAILPGEQKWTIPRSASASSAGS